MHKTILAALAALGLAAGASAQTPESWIYAGMQGGAMGWDASAISRDASADTASTMRFVYFGTPRQGVTTDYSWVLQGIEFDCDANTFRLMQAAYFNEARRGRTDRGASNEILPVRANTPESVLKQVLCDGAVVSGAGRASSMADALDGAQRVALR
jgi:hypothetical protein